MHMNIGHKLSESQKIKITSVGGNNRQAKIMFDWPEDQFVDFVVIAKSKEYKVLTAENAISEKCIDTLYPTKDIWRDNGGGLYVNYGYTYTLFPYISRSKTILAQVNQNSTGIVASVTAMVNCHKQKRSLFDFSAKPTDERVTITLSGTDGLPDDLGGSCWYKISCFDYKYPVSLAKLKNGCLYVPLNSEITFFSECQNGNYINFTTNEQKSGK